MSLTRIEYGSVASSTVMNNNFNYLESLIENLADNLTSQTNNYSARLAAMSTSINNVVQYRDQFIQIGTVLPFTGNTLPTGFLLCDGSALLIEDFQDLYSVIGTTYGTTSAAKFNLPDFRDKTFWGAGGTSALGTVLDSKLPNIRGEFRLAGTEGYSALSGAFFAGGSGGTNGKGHSSSASNPLIRFDASLFNAIYSNSCNIVQPPAIAVKFIIKY